MNRALKAVNTMLSGRLALTFDRVDFEYNGLSWKRRWNWLLAELSYVARTDRVWALPTHLQIEPINICNLRCPVCHVVTDHKPRGRLDPADYRALIDEVGDQILFLHFWGWGEPFLNPDTCAMIRYAKDKGIKIISSTNGHFFESQQGVDRLIDSGLDVLIFALDGVDRETYEKYRHSGDFERVMNGLRHLLARRRERGVRQPRVNLRMLVTRHNEEQVLAMRRLARDLGVDLFTLKTLCSFDNESEGAELLPEQREYRRFRYEEGAPLRIDNPCRKLWNHPTVYRDGAVVPCDYHTGEEISLGNAFSRTGGSFRNVWFGEPFRRLRWRFLKNERSGLRCDDCSLNYADVDRCVSHAFQTR